MECILKLNRSYTILRISFIMFIFSGFGERRGLVVLLLLSYRCLVTVNVLPHGAVGWSAVCDCGIS